MKSERGWGEEYGMRMMRGVFIPENQFKFMAGWSTIEVNDLSCVETGRAIKKKKKHSCVVHWSWEGQWHCLGMSFGRVWRLKVSPSYILGRFKDMYNGTRTPVRIVVGE